MKRQEYNSLFVAPVIEEIVWFDVSVDDSKLVDVSQGLQQVIDVESNLFKAHWANDVLTNKVFNNSVLMLLQWKQKQNIMIMMILTTWIYKVPVRVLR